MKSNHCDGNLLSKNCRCCPTRLTGVLQESSRCFRLWNWPHLSFSLSLFLRISREKRPKTECFDRKRKSDSEKQSKLQSQRWRLSWEQSLQGAQEPERNRRGAGEEPERNQRGEEDWSAEEQREEEGGKEQKFWDLVDVCRLHVSWTKALSLC